MLEENVQVREIPAQPHVGKAEDAPTPRCSTDTPFNFDISSDIPKVSFANGCRGLAMGRYVIVAGLTTPFAVVFDSRQMFSQAQAPMPILPTLQMELNKVCLKATSS